MRRYLPCFIIWLMMLALLSRYALAATLQVAPVTLDLQSGQRATAVYLTNSGKSAIHAQIRVYEWSQKNGKDVLAATEEVVSSPAMTSLAPGQQQLVRIIVMRPGLNEQEQSYRLVIDELPDAAARAASPNAVHFLLRYSIPVFIAGNQTAPVSRDALSCEQADTPATIRCYNAGNSHIRLSHLQALTASGQAVASIKGLAGYVLPGQTALLTFRHAPRHTLSALRAYINDDHNASQIPLRPLAARAPALATAHAVSPG
ncbi:molecular chaperone [Enterobacter pasteurii]|uniref:Molecular chaperone n=2 Tax=Enterobacter cloacae complex TaxID=354276 RepID=A0A7H8U9E5_ENTCL|nr:MULTISPECIES: molecular chaperone [Enterobacter cloacae complex]MBE4862672.1 molecular chaperone [Enterobacter cloacae complex sp. P40C2]MBE4875195.1 molecular chaperone [Enterobacter cloacae complex sp. P40C]MCM7513982.1 molecular chaperone [Enterobacter hormaechei]MBE4853476.1 molecular chaperone [Enterobacter pasteurii]MCY0773664.1 molecular chaperone [Enterobacter cloacae complex sp. 2022EL-00788]